MTYREFTPTLSKISTPQLVYPVIKIVRKNRWYIRVCTSANNYCTMSGASDELSSIIDRGVRRLGAINVEQACAEQDAIDALLAVEKRLADAERTIAEQIDAIFTTENKLADAEKTIGEQREEEPTARHCSSAF